MAPPRKCTPEQLAFLQSHLPEYNALRNATQSAMFWVSVTAEYFVKFPIRSSLITEGILPSEDAVIQPPADEIDAIVGAAIAARKKYIQRWYHNSKKLSNTPKASSKGILKAKLKNALKSQRRHQAEEMFEMLYKDDINSYVAERISGISDKSLRMEIRRAARKHCWEMASDEVKAAVSKALENESERIALTKGVDDRTIEERSPSEIHDALSELQSLLIDVCDDVYNMTGWTLVCLMGGPKPAEGGSIGVSTVTTVKNEVGFSFPQGNLKAWQTGIVPLFGAWLADKYPPDVRNLRSLENSNWAPPIPSDTGTASLAVSQSEAQLPSTTPELPAPASMQVPNPIAPTHSFTSLPPAARSRPTSSSPFDSSTPRAPAPAPARPPGQAPGRLTIAAQIIHDIIQDVDRNNVDSNIDPNLDRPASPEPLYANIDSNIDPNLDGPASPQRLLPTLPNLELLSPPHFPQSRPAPNLVKIAKEKKLTKKAQTVGRGRGRGRGHGRGRGRGRGGRGRQNGRGHESGSGSNCDSSSDASHDTPEPELEGISVNQEVPPAPPRPRPRPVPHVPLPWLSEDSSLPQNATPPVPPPMSSAAEETRILPKRSRQPPRRVDGSYAPQVSITAAQSAAAALESTQQAGQEKEAGSGTKRKSDIDTSPTSLSKRKKTV